MLWEQLASCVQSCEAQRGHEAGKAAVFVFDGKCFWGLAHCIVRGEAVILSVTDPIPKGQAPDLDDLGGLDDGSGGPLIVLEQRST